MIYVLDASVILKWFLEEHGTEEALVLKNQYERGEIDLVEPDLLIYEIANVLRFKKGFPEIAIKSAIQSLYNLQIEFITPIFPIMEEAIHLSLKTNLTIYDAIYCSLSKRLSSTLITADKKIYLNTKAYLPVKSLFKF